jgi:HEAT repeat protein
MDKKDRPREILVELLEDPSRRVRSAAVDALGDLGDRKAIGDLGRFAKTTKSDGERRNAERAVEQINAAREQTDEVRQLRKEVDKLKKSGEEVDKRVKELESLLEAMKEKEEDKVHGDSEPDETADEDV